MGLLCFDPEPGCIGATVVLPIPESRTRKLSLELNNLVGKFIVFDGPDGCGKTTQRDMVGACLEERGLDVVLCKDPGGSVIGDRIRHILLDYDLSGMDVRCETLLFMASRAQLVAEIIDPALAEGKVVLCDRFVSSTCAYQVAAGFDLARVLEVAPFAIGSTWPDVTIVLDVDIATGFERTGRTASQSGRNRKASVGQHSMFEDAVTDAMEARPLEFHRRVRKTFLTLAEHYPRPVEVIDAQRDSAAVHEDVMAALATRFSDG